MKRFLLIFFSSIFALTVFSQSKGFSRWSFTPEYGYDVFDGDINQNLINVIPTSFRDITYGANLEYALTPIWGLALDYYYFPLRAKNNSPIPILINTNLMTSNINATINFTRLIFPQSQSKIYFLGSVGLGLAYYTYDVRHPDGTPVLASETYVDIKYTNQPRPVLLYDGHLPMKYGMSVSLPITFSVEYNFSKPLAIGAKIMYVANNKDNLEGVTYLNYDGVTNDYIGAGTVYLRYKFNSFQKDHLRNIKWDVYQPDKGLQLAQELGKKLDKLNTKVDTIAKKVNDLIPRVTKLENLLSNDGPDSDGDGVPDVRDLDPHTPPNTPVDFWGRPLVISGSNITGDVQGGGTGSATVGNVGSKGDSRARMNWDDIPAVYFDFDRIDLDDNALITISKIAKKMKDDPNLYVEVRGYCDYAGNNPYNNLLSQRRSDRVKKELVNVWGIAFDHIISNGKGKALEPKIKYRPNRRCDFFFGKL